jgi:P-type conjugative transfer protein TrbJ
MICCSRIRRAVHSLAIASLQVSLIPMLAAGQLAVFDPTNYAENVLHYAKAVQELRAASTQIANQVTALRKLANPRFRDITATWGSVDAAMGSGSGILYRQNDPSASLRSIYPGVVANQHYVPEREAQVGTTLATAVAVLKAARAQGGTFDDGRQQLDAMKSQVGTIQGHEQALELQNTVGLFGANEAMLTRQAIEGQANLEAVYYAQQVNAEAQAEANARQAYASMGAQSGTRRALLSFRPGA